MSTLFAEKRLASVWIGNSHAFMTIGQTAEINAESATPFIIQGVPLDRSCKKQTIAGGSSFEYSKT